jgi:uncharacterized membrane protein YciS (DUF1049 family)
MAMNERNFPFAEHIILFPGIFIIVQIKVCVDQFQSQGSQKIIFRFFAEIVYDRIPVVLGIYYIFFGSTTKWAIFGFIFTKIRISTYNTSEKLHNNTSYKTLQPSIRLFPINILS